jgi:hypothetical protein
MEEIGNRVVDDMREANYLSPSTMFDTITELCGKYVNPPNPFKTLGIIQKAEK